MRAILTDETTPVYASTDDNSLSIAMLRKDDEFEIGRVLRKKRKTWVEVTLDSGASGYISGDAHLFGLKKVVLQDASAEMRAGPSADSEVLKTLNKGDGFFTLGVVKTEDAGWVKVKDASETEGYIIGNTKIRVIQVVTRAEARKTLVWGAILLAAGAVFGLISYLDKQSSVTIYYLAIGFILFGFMQLMQGFMQQRQANAQEKDPLLAKKSKQGGADQGK